MSTDRDLEERRLHPSSLGFSLLKHLRQFLAPIAIMFFVSKESDSWQIYGTVLLIPLMVYEAWRYFNLRYLIADGELIVREGVIFKNVRHVPLERIQSIDSTQNFLHRLLNVADVRVETAGNTEPEAELRVLSIAARDQLRGIVFSANGAPSPEAVNKEAIQPTTQLSGPTFDFHLPAPELALLGLNPLKGLAILGVGLGLAGQLGLLENASIGGFFKTLLSGASLASNFAMGVAVVFAVGLAILLLSMAATFVGLHDFTLTRTGAEFRVQCGLFTRRTTTVPIGRVQYVIVRANPILRALNRSSIQIETAGGKNEDERHTQRWLMPVVRNEFVPSLLHAIDPAIDLECVDWQALTPRAGRRRLFRALRFSLVFAIPPLFFLESWGALVLALGQPVVTGLLLALAHKTHLAIGWASSPFGTLMRTGVFTKSIGIALAGRVQAITVQSSPFDRRYGHATFRIDTAGAGREGNKVSIEFMSRDVAVRLRDQLLWDLEHKRQDDGLVRA